MQSESGGPPFQEAADALASGDPARASAGAMRFLELLGYAGPQPPAEMTGNRVSLLRFAARMRTVMPYRMAEAPGLLFFLGMFDTGAFAGWGDGEMVSTIGAALRPDRAFEASVGEAVEYASQLQRRDDPLQRPGTAIDGMLSLSERSALAALLGVGDPMRLRDLDWLPARRLADGAASVLPADLCLRRPTSAAGAEVLAPLSIGCAAAPTRDEAVLRGLLELVERDAAALWWRGGRKAATLPLDGAAAQQAMALLQDIRNGSERRATWLLDITTEFGIPCVAALSVDAAGRRIACGLAAGLSPGDAASSAIREMCQYELGYHLIDVKRRANPDHALTPVELAQLRRGAEILPDEQPLLHPALGPRHHAVPGDLDPAEAVGWVASRLRTVGFHAHAVGLTRADFDIPVVKVVMPGLQLDPSDAITPRLARCFCNAAEADQALSRLPLH
ncbi:YcaO-like family protein [Inquilinus sp. NPDC058860]|uniref:YcaO-like family protein n=1 Tax=Inquilinus sp. NPDC058860 TaxID=3346652 RepID=UPI0036AA7E62